ncbi:MAG: hypothetical protein ABFS28_11370 [Bacteroidota bacterium]
MDTISKYVVLLFLVCCFGLCACSKGVAPKYEIITIQGVSWACNVNSSYAIFGSLAESELEPEVTLPVSDGDLLYMVGGNDQEFYYRYSRRDGMNLVVRFDTLNANTACLNGQLKSVELSDNQDSWELIKQLTDPQRKQLSTLHITGSLSDHSLSLLQQHESSLQGTGLLLEGECNLKLLGELLSICRPGWLMLEGPLNLPDPENCMALSHIELLWIEEESHQDPALFSHCTNLESLIISGWKPGEGELLSLSGSGSLHTLTLAECGINDFSSIEFPTSLRRLHFIACDTLTDIRDIHKLKRLKGLSFSGSPHIQEILQLNALTRIKWLGFPENVSQSEFASLLGSLSKLEAIELLGCQKIENISPLLNLNKLKILLVDLPIEKLADLGGLKDLNLLILASDHFEENPNWIGQIKTSLPSAVVVPGSGLCLGSGWILLLLPLVLLSRLLIPNRRSQPLN